MSIDLDPRVLQLVTAILRTHVPDCEVWAFGSRVDSRSKPFSDLDLAVISAGELPTRRPALLAHAFEDSDLPIRIEVVDWHSTSAAFRQRIAQHHAVLQRPTSE